MGLKLELSGFPGVKMGLGDRYVTWTCNQSCFFVGGAGLEPFEQLLGAAHSLGTSLGADAGQCCDLTASDSPISESESVFSSWASWHCVLAL